MTEKFRRLNEAGIAAFSQYISEGAEGPAPVHLLVHADTSAPLHHKVEPGTGHFDDRYMFGVYLNTLLREFDPATISGDAGLWSALALFWFDLLCPPNSSGSRSLRKSYRYILSRDYRHYYRHLVRSPWQLVKDHGEASRFLLISPRMEKHPLSVPGEIFEQFGGRQQVFGSTPIIKSANKLYFDTKTHRPRTGVAGRKGGSAHRFGLVLRQLALTYDPDCMSEDDLIGILPIEFGKWRTVAMADQMRGA